MSVRLYSFETFELDAAKYELRHEGKSVKLERIPMELLFLLVERHGELVTRQEIVTRIWGKDVFVDSEQGINTAMRKVRLALGDDPELPRLVQTVVGKGYRFVGELKTTANEEDFPPIEHKAVGGRDKARQIFNARWRGIAVTILVLSLMATGFLLWRRVSAAPEPIRSIAVLPLENLSGDKSQDYFADGLTDAIITQLAKFRPIRVISRSSVMQYKGVKKPLNEIAQALNVDAVVEGSVSREGDHVRVTAQLISARDDRHLWADEFDRDVRDILSLQSEIARDIAGHVHASLATSSSGSSSAVVDPAAYEAYLRGRSYWNQRTRPALESALNEFKVAVELDPNYAEGYSGLADTYAALGYTSFWAPKQAFAPAGEAAKKALQLDPTLAEAHASLGYVKLYYEWDWDGAQAQFKEAIALNPNYATAYHWYSVFLTSRGRFEDARVEIGKARELDPLSVPISTDVGFELYYAGKYDEAIKQLRVVLEGNPRFPLAHLWLGRCYEQKAMYAEAIIEFEQADKVLKDWPVTLAAEGYTYGKWGRREQAEAVLNRMKELSKTTYVTPYGFALVYAGMGRREEAFSELQTAVSGRSHWLVWVAIDPRFESLHKDKRWLDLISRINETRSAQT